MALPPRPRAVVTGAGSGLGRALSLELARRGGRIIAADIDLDAASETVGLLGAGGVCAFRCDVSKADEVAALAEVCDRELGGLDLVVNNAGVAVSGLVGEVPLSDWEWIVGVNLWGVVHGCHVFAPRLRAQGHGAILNVASAAGLMSAPTMAPYCATKAAVVAMSEALHAELARCGVSVTVLCPTFFRTNIGRSARGGSDKTRSMVEKMMARASTQAEDVARVGLDAVAASRLYALPHADGRWAWRLKRAVPRGFAALMARLAAYGVFDP